jgi:L-amino acid N-acyltransferase YncA
VKLEVRLGDLRDVDGAAQVWARATANRDGKREIPPLEAAKRVLLNSLQKERSTFVVAANEGQVLGFATAEPHMSQRIAETRFWRRPPSRTAM